MFHESEPVLVGMHARKLEHADVQKHREHGLLNTEWLKLKLYQITTAIFLFFHHCHSRTYANNICLLESIKTFEI
jgi:hypothetical protein